MYTYSLSEKDLLNFLLYDISTDAARIVQRKRSTRNIIITFGIVGAIAYFVGMQAFGLSFLALVIVLVFFGDAYMKYIYKRAFKKAVRTSLKSYADSPITLEIGAEHLKITDHTGEHVVECNDIELLHETRDYFLIKLESTQMLGIRKISDELEKDMQEWIAKNEIPYREFLDWKW
ncbi:MAG TPA: hypothetical protein VKB19_01385 [Pedobacter sp.]|nr:hypothetical protein [Pedobacter sp.]